MIKWLARVKRLPAFERIFFYISFIYSFRFLGQHYFLNIYFNLSIFLIF